MTTKLDTAIAIVGAIGRSDANATNAIPRLAQFSVDQLKTALNDLLTELDDAVREGHQYRAGNLRKDIDDLRVELRARGAR